MRAIITGCSVRNKVSCQRERGRKVWQHRRIGADDEEGVTEGFGALSVMLEAVFVDCGIVSVHILTLQGKGARVKKVFLPDVQIHRRASGFWENFWGSKSL